MSQTYRRGESPHSDSAPPVLAKPFSAHGVAKGHKRALLASCGAGKTAIASLLLIALCYAVYLWMLVGSHHHHSAENAVGGQRKYAPVGDASPSPPIAMIVPGRQLEGSVCSLLSRNSNDPQSTPLTILCVGDSITYGNGSHVRRKERDHEGNFPIALEQRLWAACGSRAIRVINLGSSGKTLMDGFKQSYKNSSVFRTAVRSAASAQVMIIMLGTNDSKPRHWHGKEAFANSLVEMVEYFAMLKPTLKMVLMTPPPSYPDPRTLARLNKVSVLGGIRPVVIRNDIRIAVMIAAERAAADLIDLFGEMETIQELHSLPVDYKSILDDGEVARGAAVTIQRYFHDGVHPSLATHERIADIVARELTHSM